MSLIQKLALELGQPYRVKPIDTGDVIFRELPSGYELELSVVSNKSSTLYVWSINPRILVGIYENIPNLNLKDVLGYYAARYQRLPDHIQVEREDIEV